LLFIPGHCSPTGFLAPSVRDPKPRRARSPGPAVTPASRTWPSHGGADSPLLGTELHIDITSAIVLLGLFFFGFFFRH
jgi:hypothetical protein